MLKIRNKSLSKTKIHLILLKRIGKPKDAEKIKKQKRRRIHND